MLLHHRTVLIRPVTPVAAPEVEPQLAAWPISGNSTKMSKFLVQAQSYCWHCGGQSPQNLTTLFEKWVCWCSQRGTDPISESVSDVVNFLV